MSIRNEATEALEVKEKRDNGAVRKLGGEEGAEKGERSKPGGVKRKGKGIEEMTVRELKAEMKKRRMKGYTSMTLQELKDRLKKEVRSQMTMMQRRKPERGAMGRGAGMGGGKEKEKQEETPEDETGGGDSHADMVNANSEYGIMDKAAGESGEYGIEGGGGGEEEAAAQWDPASQGRGDADGAMQGEWG